jgi:UDP-N-acetylglucosamine 2-epimerase (non-hydrolysing)
MRLLHVAGARPNFMKVAALMHAGAARGVEQVLVHTGQHYDASMSDVFFADLELPRPDHHLGVGGGSHAEQTAKVMTCLEPLIARERPDWVVVVGDVNSTLAAALTAAKLNIKVAHVEAGLRSFDRTMPEEVNRVVVDGLSDLLFTPSADADLNLLREGHPPEQIKMVGNVMIDALQRSIEPARRRRVPARFGLEPRRYAVLTLHRPSNVDDPVVLGQLLETLLGTSGDLSVIFPVHPRTRARLQDMAAAQRLTDRLRLIEPLGYLDFLGLVDGALVVLTDSGGLQEETTVLGIPCLTLRENTERPVTVTLGTNRLVGRDPVALARAFEDVFAGRWPRGSCPPRWDGHAGERVIDVLLEATEGTAQVAHPEGAENAPRLVSW